MGNRVNWKKKIFFKRERRTEKVSRFITFLISTFFFLSRHFQGLTLRKGVGRKQRKIFSGPPAVFTGEKIAAPPCGCHCTPPPHILSFHLTLLDFSFLILSWGCFIPSAPRTPLKLLLWPHHWLGQWQVCSWYVLEPR